MARTGEDSCLSIGYRAFLTIARLPAVIGAITASPVTVVGATVPGPEFGPLADGGRHHRVGRGVRVRGAGRGPLDRAPGSALQPVVNVVGVVVAAVLVLLLSRRPGMCGRGPRRLSAG